MTPQFQEHFYRILAEKLEYYAESDKRSGTKTRVEVDFLMDVARDAYELCGKMLFTMKKASTPTQPKERWRAKKNKRYFYIDTKYYFSTEEEYDIRTTTDEKRYINGNYFQTKAQAESALEKMKELLKSLHQ